MGMGMGMGMGYECVCLAGEGRGEESICMAMERWGLSASLLPNFFTVYGGGGGAVSHLPV